MSRQPRFVLVNQVGRMTVSLMQQAGTVRLVAAGAALITRPMRRAVVRGSNYTCPDIVPTPRSLIAASVESVIRVPSVSNKVAVVGARVLWLRQLATCRGWPAGTLHGMSPERKETRPAPMPTC